MPRLAVALLGIVLLAGCSAGAGDPQSDPTATQRGEGDLEGVTSEYSVRLAEMPNYEALDADSAMRNGLIAGDDAVHVAASAFRVGDYYGLDLIVTNRAALPLEVQRDDVRMVDSSGQWMNSVDDFPRAADHGLRGSIERPANSIPYDGLGLYDNGSYGDPVRYSSDNPVRKNPGSSGAEVDEVPSGQGLTNYEWNSELPSAPAILEVPGGEGRAWWVYWKSETPPVFPVTAFVTVDGRHMIFIFED